MKRVYLREKIPTYIGNILVYGFLGFILIVTFIPLWNVFVLSLNDATDSMQGGFMLWPRKFSIDSYITVLSNPEIHSAAKVTILRTLIGIPYTVTIVSMTAYVLSKKNLIAKRAINFFFIFTMYFSGSLIPTYMVMKGLGLIDNFLVFILPLGMNVFWMILVRTFMEGLPDELEEAAQIEGANDIQIFLKIVIPICTPVLATIVLFVAIQQWNSWYDSYIYTYKPNLKTLPAVLVKILNQYQTKDMAATAKAATQGVTAESIRMATTMVATLPIIMIYPLLQKFFLKGMLLGAVKD